MEKNDQSSMKFDDQEEDINEPGIEDATNPEDVDAEPKPEDGTDLDEESKDKEDEEGYVEDEKESSEDGEAEIDQRDVELSDIKKEMATLKETIEQANKPQPSQPYKYSDEEKQQIEERSGMEFKQVEFIETMQKHTINQIRQFVESQLGDINKVSAIDKFSKNPEFADASKHREGMEQFLSTRPAAERSKPETLETAYHYARGLSMKNTKKATRSQDRNKRIVTSSRRSGIEKTHKTSSGLSNDERLMAREAGISEKEYSMYKTTPIHKMK